MLANIPFMGRWAYAKHGTLGIKQTLQCAGITEITSLSKTALLVQSIPVKTLANTGLTNLIMQGKI